MAQLETIIAELRSMDEARVGNIVRNELAKAARPFAPLVRASILNIPTHGVKHTGLRARIARCVQTFAYLDGPVVQVGIKINPGRMGDPSEFTLPLYMEGAKAPWRHPVFGGIRWNGMYSDLWVTQAPHPYFYQATALLGPASQRAMQRATDQITRAISGFE